MAKAAKRSAAPTDSVREKKRPKIDAQPAALEPQENFPRGHAKADPAPASSKRKATEVDDAPLFASAKAPDAPTLDQQLKQKRKLERKKTAKKLEEAKKSLAEKEIVAPTHVSHKRLIPGSRLLACITSISDTELIVSLPGLLSGHISYSRAIRLPADSDSDEEDEDDEEPALKNIYHVGQLLVVAVVATFSTKEVRATSTFKSFELDNQALVASRRIQLTLDPEAICEGIGADDLAAGFPVNAAVLSREDAGYVLDIGVGGVTSFLSFADAEKHLSKADLAIGSYLSARITAMHANKRTCSLSLEAFSKSATIEQEVSIDAVLPGMLVKARVTSVDKGSVAVRFMGLFDGAIDAVHLANRENMATAYHVGQQLKARVVASLPWQSSRTFTLTNLPHLLAGNARTTALVPVGTIAEGVKVLHVERHWGLLMALPNVEGPDVPAFCSIKQASDEHLEQLQPDSGPWSANSTHRVRVIGYSAFTGLLSVSMRQSVLEQKYMAVSDLQVGQLVEGVVQRLTSEALFVSIGGAQDAIIWPVHYADVRLKHPDRKFKPGVKLQCRVFSIDAARNRIALTLKPSLVKSSLPIHSSVDDIPANTRVAGVISRIETAGAVVELFGGHRIFIPLAELSDDFVARSEDAVSLGKSVEALMLGKGRGPGRPRATLKVRNAPDSVKEVAKPRKSGDSKAPEIARTSLDLDTLEIGAVMPVRLVKRDMHGWLVQLSPNLRGRVNWTDVADDYDEASRYEVNQVVQAAIIAIDQHAAQIDLALRLSLVESEGEVRDPLLADIGDLQTGMRVRGIVSNIAKAGLFVAIARSVTARVQIKELFDDFVEDWQSKFRQGQVVEGSLLSVDADKEQVEMRLRTGEVSKSRPSTASVWSTLQPGQQVKCRVKALRPYGCLLALQDSYISGLCHKSQMTSRKKSLVEVDERLSAVIVEVDPEKQRISFSLDLVEEEDEAADEDTAMAVDGEEEADEVAFGGFEDDEEDDEDDGVAAVTIPSVAAKAPPAALAVSSGFNWDAPAAVNGEVAEKMDEDPLPPSRKAADKKKKAVNGHAAAEAGPSSKTDYEQLVQASPDSSSAWISYIKHCLDAADVNEARQVARRALDIISYREEEEKLNVWMTLLNLELTRGSEASFDAVFADAIQFNDAFTVHVRLADIYEQAGQFGKVAPMLTRSQAKFSGRVDYWLRLARAYFRQSTNALAHETLQRSLKSLPTKQHIDMISRFAQLEFKMGDPERGRTLFEGVLDKAPKRLDLWNVYIDMEEHTRHFDGVRALFTRVLDRRLSTKKTKALLKKWLAFEKTHGSEGHVEAVRQKAIEYVQRDERPDEEDGE